MPTTKTWGPLTLTRTGVPGSDSSLSLADREAVYTVSEFDCFPPPGSSADYVRRNEISPQYKRRSLQDVEKTRLELLPTLMGAKRQSARSTRRSIRRRLDFQSMDISYDGAAYRALRRHHDCFTSTLYLRVKFSVAEVEVTANQNLQLGNESFSAGDPIATYRVRQPEQYRFEVHHLWNPRCCPDKPARERESEHTEYYWRLESIDVFAPRREDEWKAGLNLKYESNDWSRYLRLRWDYLDDDD